MLDSKTLERGQYSRQLLASVLELLRMEYHLAFDRRRYFPYHEPYLS